MRAWERDTRVPFFLQMPVYSYLSISSPIIRAGTHAKDDEDDEFFICSMHSDIIGMQRGSAMHSKAAHLIEGAAAAAAAAVGT